MATLDHIKTAGVSLNKAKCKFSVISVKFLGHIVNKDGIKADKDKTAAILNMKPPQIFQNFEGLWGWRTNWESFHAILHI